MRRRNSRQAKRRVGSLGRPDGPSVPDDQQIRPCLSCTKQTQKRLETDQGWVYGTMTPDGQRGYLGRSRGILHELPHQGASRPSLWPGQEAKLRRLVPTTLTYQGSCSGAPGFPLRWRSAKFQGRRPVRAGGSGRPRAGGRQARLRSAPSLARAPRWQAFSVVKRGEYNRQNEALSHCAAAENRHANSETWRPRPNGGMPQYLAWQGMNAKSRSHVDEGASPGGIVQSIRSGHCRPGRPGRE